MNVWHVFVSSQVKTQKFWESWGNYHIIADDFDNAVAQAKIIQSEETKEHPEFRFAITQISEGEAIRQ